MSFDPEALEQASQEELAEIAAACLSRFEPGVLPEVLFAQVSRLIVTSSIEVFALNTVDKDDPEVLFTQRPGSDPWWSGQWHAPGSVLLADDEIEDVHDFSAPSERVFGGELGHIFPERSKLTFYDIQRRAGARGAELSPFFWAEVQVDPSQALPPDMRFYGAAELESEPPVADFIEGHARSALEAIEAYREPDTAIRRLLELMR